MKSRTLQQNQVLAIVVTYNPDEQFPERLKVIAGQVGAVLVVDNRSNEAAVAMLQRATAESFVQLNFNVEHLGVATALNIGIRHALAADFSWVLLFDQDTMPGTELLAGIQRTYEAFPGKEKVAVIGANYIDAGTGQPRSTSKNDNPWIERHAVITSGSLVSLDAYQALGPFRDEYFIDSVDLEYCLRARVRGFHVIMTRDILMVHDVGRTVLHQIGWKKAGTSNHNRIRRYYMMRNHIDMTKRYLWKEPAWLLHGLWTLLKSLVLICIFEEGRFGKLKYAAIGLADGLRSRFDRQVA